MAMLPLTERFLKTAMRDPRYWQSGHPEFSEYRAWITSGWRSVAEAPLGEGGDTQTVQVRAYERSRAGRRHHVDSYAQTRRRARPDTPAPSSPALTESPAELPPIAAPSTPQGPIVVIFIGGGGEETLDGPVVQYARIFGEGNPGVTMRRFTHDQTSEIEQLIRSQPPGARVRIVGPSWGGDTAAEIAATMGAEGRSLDMLVTADPVGRFTSTGFFERVRNGTRRWINVNAVGGSPWDSSNLARRLGSPYGAGPMGHAHEFIPAPDDTHRDFGSMLGRRTSEGRSVLEEILAR